MDLAHWRSLFCKSLQGGAILQKSTRGRYFAKVYKGALFCKSLQGGAILQKSTRGRSPTNLKVDN
ncbi:hypothetical protein [Calothrix sp. 336/3]|uniref:hypothetical protein n=1 Tax=Calothrix sp. 336/3 TaxID=1337936 RepID=UPI000AB15BA9|nr:hypothetical protein [Calothrix sp. 336/3]